MTVNARELVASLGAILVLLTFCLIIMFDVVNGKAVVLPDALLVVVSLVTGVYYGQHSATNGAYAAGILASSVAANTTAAANATANKPTP
jgi:hypothetical protein